MLITVERQLRLVLAEHVDYYDVQRPHRALQQSPPAGHPVHLLWAQTSEHYGQTGSTA
jgi:hypothetical protein